ncbi:MAG: VOC family protein [Ilumatobacteraceae bacterium]|nr:VOC family protein [Acidimicrobiales bacterium]MCB9393382.1 VOC family protein [Acidimicrobiaceae bacterium]
MTDTHPRLSLGHVTLAVRDLDRMVAFYTDVLGFQVSNRGEPVPGMGEMAFLTQDPSAHHQIVLVQTPEPPTRAFMLADHMAFRASSLDELRTIGQRLAAAEVTSVIPISHGNAWSLYFTDPEGNGVECFVDSPFHVAQPYADGLDLTSTDAEIAATTRSKIESLPEFQAFDDWRAAMAARLDGAQG